MKISFPKPDSSRLFPCRVCGETRDVGTRCPDFRMRRNAKLEKEASETHTLKNGRDPWIRAVVDHITEHLRDNPVELNMSREEHADRH
jgi:hypothetical protein